MKPKNESIRLLTNDKYQAQLLCPHCGEEHVHQVAAGNQVEESSKDSVFGKTIAVFGCECCPGVSALFLWHHKGFVFLQLRPLQAIRNATPDPSLPWVNVEGWPNG
jgi:hypothetical protein